MCALLGYALSHLGGCCSLSLVGPILLDKKLLDVLEVHSHSPWRLGNHAMGKVVLVPLCNWEVTQDDTHVSSLGEGDIAHLHGGDSQGAVLDGRENP
jgi:hypothetical protein